MKYYIKTFGCQQNVADSERLEQTLHGRGMTKARGYKDSNYVVINTCMIRRSAEDRVYGLVRNLGKLKEQKRALGEELKIIVTGCMVGVAFRDKSGVYLQTIRKRMPEVDEFMPIEEIGFDHAPLRQNREHAWVPISNGCNNFCTFCIVPFTRGREMSRPLQAIIDECKDLQAKDYKKVTLLGQNVNSYGSDIILGAETIQAMRDIDKKYFERADGSETVVMYNDKPLKPVYVKHLGRKRIPTLFPHLLDLVAKLGFETVEFMSSNPWDFSDELIEVISRNPNITRTIHLPVQSGDNDVLKRMNRWYTREEYLHLIEKMRTTIPDLKITTDIIVGFCKETDEEFENTKLLADQVGFEKAYISIYSERPMTAATKVMEDDVPYAVKKQRWEILNTLINSN